MPKTLVKNESTISVDQAAALGKVSSNTIRNWIKKGEVASARIEDLNTPSGYRYSVSETDVVSRSLTVNRAAQHRRPRTNPQTKAVATTAKAVPVRREDTGLTNFGETLRLVERGLADSRKLSDLRQSLKSLADNLVAILKVVEG